VVVGSDGWLGLGDRCQNDRPPKQRAEHQTQELERCGFDEAFRKPSVSPFAGVVQLFGSVANQSTESEHHRVCGKKFVHWHRIRLRRVCRPKIN
jgi:hypothetical protein